jgi:KDO2-lipid IV(A) lauroyltransferase
VTAAARLAKLSDALVVPCVTRLTARGYEVQLYPAWEDFPGASIATATERVNAFIEARVREMPEQYLWTHKRFKTRPPGEAGFYPP